MPQRLLRNSTSKVSEALQSAIMEAANLRKGVVAAEFILLSLVEQEDSIVLKVLDELGRDTGEIRNQLTDWVMDVANSLPAIDPRTPGGMKITGDVQALFQRADQIRNKLGDAYISTGTMFLAAFDTSVPGTSKVLKKLKLGYEECEKMLLDVRGSNKIDAKDAETRQTMLDKYTNDVTAMARRGLLDPVIGREKEIKRVIEILSRRKKNNPVLIGEPGVGKTVIVEGLAQQIVAADVPEYLLNKRVLSLEMGSLIAGAKMQGEFEERLKSVVDEVVAASGSVILFIDELHTVVGAGRSGGGLDASNMLKPALARGVLQTIGATTLKEYKQYIESDKALERRFQPVVVEQPSVDETIQILQGIQPKYESHHQVEYSDEAITAAAVLSEKYLTDRFLPDKAIDLIDEAGASRRLKVIYTPPELRELETRKRELLDKKSTAYQEHDFEKMALHQMEITRVEDELREKREALTETHSKADRIVTEDDISSIISRSTGIPANRIVEEEVEKLKDIEAAFKKRIIGQDHVVESVSNAIRRNRAGLRRANRPVASFLFLGPTGVGKTEMVKAIAEQVMDDENRIIRVDMSEYMERHSVARLIGSPPGYVGYGEGGQLTEKVRRQPYSVVLFDEFEKAHPDVFNILLQVLDEGWLTDGEGRRVSFRNCIIVGTSNIGSEVLTDRKRPVGLGVQFSDWDKDDENKAVLEEVKKILRPEFINRIDEMIIFNRLGMGELGQILDLQIADLGKRVGDLGLSLEFDQEAKKLILAGIDTTNYGARPVRRALEQIVENQVAATLIGADGAQTGKNLKVGAKNGEIVISLT
jgi:ATP-dependent Clp protease ATP-binding subunit ClpC